MQSASKCTAAAAAKCAGYTESRPLPVQAPGPELGGSEVAEYRWVLWQVGKALTWKWRLSDDGVAELVPLVRTVHAHRGSLCY